MAGGNSHQRAVGKATKARMAEQVAKTVLQQLSGNTRSPAETNPSVPDTPKTENNHFNLGDSIGLASFIAMVVLVVITPPFLLKVILLPLSGVGLFVFARKSHWTYRWRPIYQYGCVSLVVVILAVVAVPQLISQWKVEHPKPILAQSSPPPLGTSFLTKDQITEAAKKALPVTPAGKSTNSASITEDISARRYDKITAKVEQLKLKVEIDQIADGHLAGNANDSVVLAVRISNIGEPTTVSGWDLRVYDTDGREHETQGIYLPAGHNNITAQVSGFVQLWSGDDDLAQKLATNQIGHYKSEVGILAFHILGVPTMSKGFRLKLYCQDVTGRKYEAEHVMLGVPAQNLYVPGLSKPY